MESALSLVQDHAATRRGRRVTRVVLRIGELAGVDVDALRFAFDVVSRGTVAEGAAFQVEEVPALAHCGECGRDFASDDLVFICPTCGAPGGEFRSGREMELSRIELS